jgi:hypothetical protein
MNLEKSTWEKMFGLFLEFFDILEICRTALSFNWPLLSSAAELSATWHHTSDNQLLKKPTQSLF